jgi:hypothetical protein
VLRESETVQCMVRSECVLKVVSAEIRLLLYAIDEATGLATPWCSTLGPAGIVGGALGEMARHSGCSTSDSTSRRIKRIGLSMRDYGLPKDAEK